MKQVYRFIVLLLLLVECVCVSAQQQERAEDGSERVGEWRHLDLWPHLCLGCVPCD
jgi:hypothetical protein